MPQTIISELMLTILLYCTLIAGFISIRLILVYKGYLIMWLVNYHPTFAAYVDARVGGHLGGLGGGGRGGRLQGRGAS